MNHWLNLKKVKKIPENENTEKAVYNVERIFNFNNQQKGKGSTRMLASQPSDVTHVAKVFDRKIFNRKVSNHPNFKILSPKQMLQRLPITLT